MKSANEEIRTRYDDLPYPSFAYPHSTPEQLAAVASLFGLPSPDVATSRVLELGAASGGNLVPFALRHPHSQAVGVDISGVQVAAGREFISRLGIDNIELREADLLELDPAALGQFDYIIAQGLYSWIPPEAQDAVLEIIRRCLSPDGVAFVSYNTYPGWKQKEIVRDAMLLHAGDRATTAAEQVAYGRAMLGFLDKVALKDGLVASALGESMAQVMNSSVSYVAHEYFAAYNQPCYFHQFVERSGKHGLAYLAEAQPAMMMPSNYDSELGQQLYGALGEDQVRVEQYLDFAIGRSFRQTLLVHSSRAENLKWQIDRKAFGDMHFAAHLVPADGTIRLDGQPQDFVTPSGSRMTAGLSGIKQAIELLARSWPGTVTREELIGYAESTTQGRVDAVSADVLSEAIDELLAKLVLRGLARFRLDPVDVSASGEHPQVDPNVRRQVAALAPDQGHVTSAWNYSLDIGDLERLLFPMMDGTLDRDGMVTVVAAALREGRLSAEESGDADVQAAKLVDAMLARFRESAVLRR